MVYINNLKSIHLEYRLIISNLASLIEVRILSMKNYRIDSFDLWLTP